MNGRAVAAWSGACLLAVLLTTNPAYRLLGLAAGALALVAAGAGRRLRALAAGLAAVTLFMALLNAAASHLGADVILQLPGSWPVVGGPWTVEALVYGALTGLTLGGAVMAVAPLSAVLEPHELLDALPALFARTGAALSASLNLVPAFSRSFGAVVEAQRLRGWRPRGPRSWAEVAVPVVLTAIEDSVQLAEAMEARGYGSGPRTTWSTGGWARVDLVTIACALVSAALLVTARAAGQAADWYPYPALAIPTLSPLALAGCLVLLLPPWLWPARA